MNQTLKVKAAHTAMCPDFEALEARILRFVGRRFDASHGAAGGWVPTDEPVSVPFRAEYVQEVKASALIPCDAETARLCGVPFTA